MARLVYCLSLSRFGIEWHSHCNWTRLKSPWSDALRLLFLSACKWECCVQHTTEMKKTLTVRFKQTKSWTYENTLKFICPDKQITWLNSEHLPFHSLLLMLSFVTININRLMTHVGRINTHSSVQLFLSTYFIQVVLSLCQSDQRGSRSAPPNSLFALLKYFLHLDHSLEVDNPYYRGSTNMRTIRHERATRWMKYILRCVLKIAYIAHVAKFFK